MIAKHQKHVVELQTNLILSASQSSWEVETRSVNIAASRLIQYLETLQSRKYSLIVNLKKYKYKNH